MKIDPTLSFSIILALVALVAPILTAIINNLYLIRMKKLELKQQQISSNKNHIKDCFEEFLSSYGKYVGSVRDADLAALKSSFYSLLPYIPSKHLDVFFKFYDALLSNNLSVSKKFMEEKLIYSIRDILQKM